MRTRRFLRRLLSWALPEAVHESLHEWWQRARHKPRFALLRRALLRPAAPPAPASADAKAGPRILCFSPYAAYKIHANWEVAILKAAQARGAVVKYVTCDGVLDACDLYRASEPRSSVACVLCQASVARTLAALALPYEWLGRYTPLEAFEEARRFAAAVPRDELPAARWRDRPIGAWVKSSVHTYFRMSQLRIEDPAVEATFRSFLAAGAVAYAGLERLFESFRPDVLFLFNGRMSAPRIALEVARARGVRVVCHERGVVRHAIQIWEDENCHGLRGARRIWDDWCGVPLERAEIAAVARWLDDRRRGRRMNYFPFSPRARSARRALRALRLDERPLVLALTSSDDEIAAAEDWGGVFPSQAAWLRATIDFFAGRPDFQLVVRVHPNTGTKVDAGANAQFIGAVSEMLRSLPENVRIVLPDDPVSTYSLMDAAAAGLTYGTTAGLEMAALGKPVAVSARCSYYGLPFVDSVERPDDYVRTLERLVRRGPSRETMRLAYRFAHRVILGRGIEITAVRQWGYTEARLVYDPEVPGDLAEGRDPGIDRVVRCLVDGARVYPPPGDAERRRATDAEDVFLAAKIPDGARSEASPAPVRDGARA